MHINNNCKENNITIRLRMLPALIKKNRAYSIWSNNKKADLYFLTMVVEDKGNVLNGLFCLGAFTDVFNNEYMNLHKTLFYRKGHLAEDIPDRLFFISTVIRCKRNIKDPTIVLDNIKNDEEYQVWARKLSSIVSGTASFSFVVNIATKFLEIAKKYLGKTDYSALATIAHHFCRNVGELDKMGKFILNRSTPNVDFGFELIVCDNEVTSGIGEYSSADVDRLNGCCCFQSMLIN